MGDVTMSVNLGALRGRSAEPRLTRPFLRRRTRQVWASARTQAFYFTFATAVRDKTFTQVYFLKTNTLT